MQYSQREKNIGYIALLVGAIFAGTTVLPMIQSIYLDREGNIEQVLLEIERETRLVEETARWRERRTEAEVRIAQLEREILVVRQFH